MPKMTDEEFYKKHGMTRKEKQAAYNKAYHKRKMKAKGKKVIKRKKRSTALIKQERSRRPATAEHTTFHTKAIQSLTAADLAVFEQIRQEAMGLYLGGINKYLELKGENHG